MNFAFASIDPDTNQVVPMDSSTPSSLFKDAANLKSIKKDLSVWVTIGGWYVRTESLNFKGNINI